SLLSDYKKLGIWYGEANLTLSDKPAAASTAAFVLYVEPYNESETLVFQTYQETLDLKAIFKRIINVNTNTVVQTWNKVTDISRSNLLDSFLYSGVLTSADDLNPLRKDGTFIATSVPINAPTGETGSAFITIKTGGSFTHQTYQRLNDSRYRYERVVQRVTADNFVAEAWRDISFLGSSNIATTSKVGTVKPSTGLTVGSDGSLSVANLARAQFGDDFNYVGGLNATNDLNIKMKEGSYLTLAVPLNAPAGINPNVLITNQNVGQRYIQTIYDLVDSRKRWQRVVRFNNDGTLNSAEAWRDLFQIPRTGLTDNFLYVGVLTTASNMDTVVKHGVYIATSAPENSPPSTPTVTIVEVSGGGSLIKQKITDAYNAAKSWTRTFQTTSPITGGAWVSNNPADNIATTSKIGGVKVG
uniref:hypothetical protein n=1 Tax=Acinetobacter sp. TaxID=472 RepID=UPI0038901C1E